MNEITEQQVWKARRLWQSGAADHGDIMAIVGLTCVQEYAITLVATDDQSDEEVAARVNEIPDKMTCNALDNWW